MAISEWVYFAFTIIVGFFLKLDATGDLDQSTHPHSDLVPL